MFLSIDTTETGGWYTLRETCFAKPAKVSFQRVRVQVEMVVIAAAVGFQPDGVRRTAEILDRRQNRLSLATILPAAAIDRQGRQGDHHADVVARRSIRRGAAGHLLQQIISKLLLIRGEFFVFTHRGILLQFLTC